MLALLIVYYSLAFLLFKSSLDAQAPLISVVPSIPFTPVFGLPLMAGIPLLGFYSTIISTSAMYIILGMGLGLLYGKIKDNKKAQSLPIA